MVLNMNEKNKNKLRKNIEELKKKEGFNTELVSLYIPHNKSIGGVVSSLKNELNQCQNIKQKLTRKNVSNSINSIIGQVAKI
jgi:peptide chain release factor subunit 1